MALQQTTDKLFHWYNSSFKIMNFGDLRDYIRDYKKMKMKHIYQPVMIKALLEAGGRCSGRQIAQKFLELDESQIDYYKKITSVMPGRVLKEKGIVSRDSDGYL